MLTLNSIKFTQNKEVYLLNKKLFIAVTTAILFILLEFMYFIDYWKVSEEMQILFFFIMVFAIFNAGIESGKIIKNRAN